MYRDIARMDDDGFVSIEGRMKDLIIRGGENIYPAEVEQFLYKHPKIADVQVIDNTRNLHARRMHAHILYVTSLTSRDEPI